MTLTVSRSQISAAQRPVSSAAEQLAGELDRVANLIEMYESDADLTPGSGELVTLESLRMRRKHVEAQLAEAQRLHGYAPPRDDFIVINERVALAVAAVAGAAALALAAWAVHRL